MKNNDKTVLSEQQAGKEYQIPELVELYSIGNAMGGSNCVGGTSAFGECVSGGSGV